MDYKDKLKLIRPFVTFDTDLRKSITPANKRLITIYYAKIYGVDGIARKRGYDLKVYRPRSKKNLNIAKKAQGLDGLGKLKAVPFTVADKSKARIKINKSGKLKVRETGVSRVVELYNNQNLIKDPEKEVKRITDKYANKARFGVLAGNFEITHFVGDAKAIQQQVLLLTERYADTYTQWMRGIAVYSFNEQSDLIEYKKKINNAKRKKKRYNVKKKNRGS